MRNIFSLFLVLIFGFTQGQELNCIVTVNADKIGSTNTQVFKTLEKSLNEFMNKTDWTGQVYKQNEKINCSMFITLTGYSSDQFTGTIQVQSSRPIFNSTYASPVLNFNDKDFNFRYIEFENLTYNPTSFDSNLVSVLAFYSYMIIGMDADTFSLQGGSKYLEMAQDVSNVALQGGFKGWSQTDGNQNRYFLINDMLSNTFSPFREAMYEYHYEGLDMMNKDLKLAKENIKASLKTIGKIYEVRPNAFITRVFFDAKSDEIVSVFSGGPNIAIADLVEDLNKISPLNSSKWAGIKF
ncbi:DUF4835 family protein [Flavobacterium sp.]|uniref:type IX secretion system protein PorD n=1 Tax=Flavobacterium sp. TaxID=239 RepID=UPI002B4B7EF0|nr:DUF4835 family protein [Flavobacterium sp.]HLF52245.1 DUF4835 family protein [Flavobacterium sp.]